jgi:hypothetical protein
MSVQLFSVGLFINSELYFSKIIDKLENLKNSNKKIKIFIINEFDLSAIYLLFHAMEYLGSFKSVEDYDLRFWNLCKNQILEAAKSKYFFVRRKNWGEVELHFIYNKIGLAVYKIKRFLRNLLLRIKCVGSNLWKTRILFMKMIILKTIQSMV